MANPKVNAGGWSPLDILTAAQCNALDDGQYYAMVRNGSTPLLAACDIDMGSYDFAIDTAGAGRFKPAAAKTKFTGAGWPEMDTHSVTGLAAPFAERYSTDWVYNPSNGDIQLGLSGSTGAVMFMFRPAYGFTLTGVRVGIRGSCSGTLPAVMPAVEARILNVVGGYDAGTLLQSFTDPSASVAAYNVDHDITGTLTTPQVFSSNELVIVRLIPQNLGGSSAGMRVYYPSIDGEISSLRTI